MIDLHSHLLPGVDDGARTVEQAAEVLRRLAAQGVTEVCLTPHLDASHAEAGVPPAHDRAFARLLQEAPAEVRLHRGIELMLDRPLGPAAAANRALTLGGTRYLLVEFPRIVPRDTVTRALEQVRGRGLVPVLAHPERYSSCDIPAAREWRSAGACLQVDGPTLLSASPRGQRARQLIAMGLAVLIAADNHGDDRSLAGAVAALAAANGTDEAVALSDRNPRALLEDRELQEVAPVELRLGVGGFVRRWFDGGGHDRT